LNTDMAADLALVRRLSGADHGLAVVAVARPDGTVHASVVNAGVLDSEAGGPYVAFVARGAAKKLGHLRRRGRAAVVFRNGWEWVSVEGPVRLVGPDDTNPQPTVALDPPGLPGLLRAIFTSAGGTHEDWPAFDRAMADEGRVAVLVRTERITGNA
jgi:PPOX class probable F420-dependent enzyme